MSTDEEAKFYRWLELMIFKKSNILQWMTHKQNFLKAINYRVYSSLITFIISFVLT